MLPHAQYIYSSKGEQYISASIWKIKYKVTYIGRN